MTSPLMRALLEGPQNKALSAYKAVTQDASSKIKTLGQLRDWIVDVWPMAELADDASKFCENTMRSHLTGFGRLLTKLRHRYDPSGVCNFVVLVTRAFDDRGDIDLSMRERLTEAEVKEWLDSPIGQRDKWIYEKRKKGVKNQQVIEELEKVFAKKMWSPIATTQGIRDSVSRYRYFTGEPELPNRKGGRPLKKTAK